MYPGCCSTRANLRAGWGSASCRFGLVREVGVAVDGDDGDRVGATDEEIACRRVLVEEPRDLDCALVAPNASEGVSR